MVMNNSEAHPIPKRPFSWRRPGNIRFSIVAYAIIGIVMCVVIGLTLTNTATSQTTTSSLRANTAYPTGTYDSADASGQAPPGATALPGYTQSYVHTFTGKRLPPGWDVFIGSPGGDPNAHLASSHVVVSGGVLRLLTYRDPAFKGAWVAGGLCLCGVQQTYGAYFVRSRITGAGPNEIQLLWPDAKVWPPEIDFNESGGVDTSSSATVHWGTANYLDQRKVNIDMTKWHTWGVIWTPKSITFTVDGQEWGVVNLQWEIPHQAMTLHIQQQTWCGEGRDCPTKAVSMLVNWVAEYTPNPVDSSTTTTVDWGTTTTTTPTSTTTIVSGTSTN